MTGARWPADLRRVIALAVVFAGLSLAACEPPEEEEAEAPDVSTPIVPVPPEGMALTPVKFEDLEGWTADDQSAALDALARSCGRLRDQPDTRPVGPDGLGGHVRDWRAPCDALDRLPPAGQREARDYFETWFRPLVVSIDGKVEGTFTGYYEIEVEGAREKREGYTAPLYEKPDDMVTVRLGRFRADLEGEHIVGRVEDGELVPYYTRAEIAEGAIDDSSNVLMWLNDPVDAFFLHIQGSGRVALPDGSRQRVGYAANNGHGFVGIGSLMLKRDLIPPGEASAQGIRKWLRAHPEKAEALMRENPRYIFFRAIDGEGPIGAQGVPLTPGRSLAVDTRFMPLGAPVWLETTWPGKSTEPLRRLMVAQDVGGAIKGAVRGDFFWGTGEEALAQAGRMKEAGRYYLLLPRALVDRRHPAS